MRAPSLAFALLVTMTLLAQEKTSSGYLLNWTGSVSPVPGDVTNGKYKLPGLTIQIAEADAGTVTSLFKTEMTGRCLKYVSGDPIKCIDAAIPEVSAEKHLVFAKAMSGKKGSPATLTIAFATNDSTAMTDQGKAEAFVQSLAVRMNRAVVQVQIDEQKKVLDKYTGKVEGAQKDQAKAQKKGASATDDLESIKKDKAKLAEKQVDLQSDVQKYQARYNLTQKEEDLKKMTKAQEQLLKVQKDMSKLLKKEGQVQKDINSQAAGVPKAQQEQIEQQTSKDMANTEMEALKRKFEAIR
ncbi:MAG: hypothetical protein IT229_03210 [Flavobacteriales bacterium]|nr:hypothetical protein [Flavobacteriales bacterium]